MSKKPKSRKSNSKSTIPGYQFICALENCTEYELKSNGLRVLHYEIPGTEVVTTNITYRVGSRDEAVGETGLAHMLEHMLFKPTSEDLRQKIDSGAMQFERETGCVLNANTWKDRTTYYFSYPKEHLARALHVEAERMDSVVISDKEFLPERNNVLSEFDMYNGDPDFALSLAMNSAAFQSHPYGHETIGFREDIEDYTSQKLYDFYRQHYRPNNATLMVFGDITLQEALSAVKAAFGTKEKGPLHKRTYPREPKQAGVRRVEVVRQSSTNMVGLGLRHEGMPSTSWYETALLLEVLTMGPESLLTKALVDTGKAVRVQGCIEPASDPNLSSIFITLAPGIKHTAIEREVLKIVAELKAKDIAHLLKKNVEHYKTDHTFTRGSSLRLAMEMTEYVSAGNWVEYFESVKRSEAVTAAQVIERAKQLFCPEQMTIGYFIGTT